MYGEYLDISFFTIFYLLSPREVLVPKGQF